MPLAVVALGVFMIFTRPRIERMVLAIAATMVFTTVAVNVVVVPAIANTLSLRDFTDHAMKIVGDSPVGYLDELNYDVAFYSRRTIPIVSQRNPQLPEYLIAWRTSVQRASRLQATPLRHRDDEQPDLARRHRRDAPASPARRFPGPAVQTLRQLHRSRNFYDMVSLRISSTAFTSRGSTSRRSAAQAHVAILRDLRLVEVHFDECSAALLHFNRESRRRINRRRGPRDDHQVRLRRMLRAHVQHVRRNRLAKGNRVRFQQSSRIADTPAAASPG